MVFSGVTVCPKCGGTLKYYGPVLRTVRTKCGKRAWISIRRLRCSKCRAFHRELPEFLFPYKHYSADIIIGVLEGFITCETIGFEDYPCERTMDHWIARKKHLLLWRDPYLKGDDEHENDPCGSCTESAAQTPPARLYRGIRKK